MSPLPPNVPSWNFQASQLKSLGDRISLKPYSPRKLASFSIAMSSWACESGHWNTNDCATTPGDTFTHPITLTVYNSSGTVIATRTQDFAIPYRPSADPTCTGANAGKWKAANGTCYNGFANVITFDLSSLNVTVPGDNFSYDVSYNTQTYGASPLGIAGPYNDLNVGVYSSTAFPSVGAAVLPGYLLWNGVSTQEVNDGGIMAQVVTTP
jgi:hypothetical protein